jgi:protein SCO1/2
MTPLRWILLAALVAGAGIGAYSLWTAHTRQQAARQAADVPPLGGSFTLVDHTGKTVTEKSYPGKYLLIFFGYTFCPDVCPTELQIIATALDELGPDIDKVQPLFISVDPLRDTLAVMGAYVSAFHPRLVGLTGTEAQVAAAAKAFRVYYAVGRDPHSTVPPADDDYLVSHSAFTYFMGPDGALRALFPHATTPEDMSEKIRQVIAADS